MTNLSRYNFKRLKYIQLFSLMKVTREIACQKIWDQSKT